MIVVLSHCVWRLYCATTDNLNTDQKSFPTKRKSNLLPSKLAPAQWLAVILPLRYESRDVGVQMEFSFGVQIHALPRQHHRGGCPWNTKSLEHLSNTVSIQETPWQLLQGWDGLESSFLHTHNIAKLFLWSTKPTFSVYSSVWTALSQWLQKSLRGNKQEGLPCDILKPGWGYVQQITVCSHDGGRESQHLEPSTLGRWCPAPCDSQRPASVVSTGELTPHQPGAISTRRT